MVSMIQDSKEILGKFYSKCFFFLKTLKNITKSFFVVLKLGKTCNLGLGLPVRKILGDSAQKKKLLPSQRHNQFAVGSGRAGLCRAGPVVS